MAYVYVNNINCSYYSRVALVYLRKVYLWLLLEGGYYVSKYIYIYQITLLG